MRIRILNTGCNFVYLKVKIFQESLTQRLQEEHEAKMEELNTRQQMETRLSLLYQVRIKQYDAAHSVRDPNTLNLDPDPEYRPILDPDPGLYYQF